MNIKQNLLYFLCKTIYRPLPIEENNVKHIISVEYKDLLIEKNTTFNVCKLNIQNKEYYFRECKKHVKFEEYLRNLINEYVDSLEDNNPLKLEFLKVRNTLMKPDVMRKLFRMGIVNDRSSKISYFFKSNDISIWGIQELENIELNELKDLFQYLWGEIYSYRLNAGLKKGLYQSFNASKSLATKKIADLLGIGYLIPEIELVKLVFPDGNEKIGTLMSAVNGIAPKKMLYAEKQKITPKFQRDCNSLNVLDAICHERDHRPGNYFVRLNSNGEVDSLEAFDNDAPMTFSLTGNINLVTYWGSSPLLLSDGALNLVHVDKKLAQKILKLKDEEIVNSLKLILSKIQVWFVCKRIHKMQKAIKHTMQKSADFFISDTEWNEKTITEELSSDTINSYLKIFCMSSRKEKNYDD
ncbi:hypothetical protein G4422_15145 [Blautia wexlerae]|uniref:hypothetical protein n=1 Tax=Blautia wexlerae TaxID=418240 RepID=UPI00156DC4BD|nr:hypothetical protein [Blautia wexlerae]NSE04723.1 hypothetical protein [Blautia wexlerae]NSF78372.1 hypothetical protein [Blautia wexlerae]